MPRQSEKQKSGGTTHKGSPTADSKNKGAIKDAKYAEDKKKMKERERVRQEHTDGPDEPEQDARTKPNRNTDKPDIDKPRYD